MHLRPGTSEYCDIDVQGTRPQQQTRRIGVNHEPGTIIPMLDFVVGEYFVNIRMAG